MTRTVGWIVAVGVATMALLAPTSAAPPAATQDPFPVSIDVDASASMGPLRHIWRFFGADEPNYATMKDGQKLLADFGALRPKDVYFRAHNLLTSGDGTPAGSTTMTHYRVDGTHSNAYSVWTRMGSPIAPDEKQYAGVARRRSASCCPARACP